MARYYENNLAHWVPGETSVIDASGKLVPMIKEEIEEIFKKLSAVKDSMNNEDVRDFSVYTGYAGFAYLELLLAEKSENNPNLHIEVGITSNFLHFDLF